MPAILVVQEAVPDVAAEEDVSPFGLEAGREQRGGRRLAIGACHRDDSARVCLEEEPELLRAFDFAAMRRGEERMARADRRVDYEKFHAIKGVFVLSEKGEALAALLFEFCQVWTELVPASAVEDAQLVTLSSEEEQRGTPATESPKAPYRCSLLRPHLV